MNSILYQGLIPGDEVLIVGDGYHEPTADLVEMMGWPFKYVATRKTRDWGHSQQNYGLQHIGGDWLLLQDDDDIFLPRAFDEARDIIMKQDEPKPIIGRVMTPYLGILWTAPGVEPLDGHCLLVPNDKEKLGYFGPEYEGDQKWLASNLDAYDKYAWADRIWTLTRPTQKLWPVRVAASGACVWTFHREKDGFYDSEHIGQLVMIRDRQHDQWHATFSKASPYTEQECKEVAEFAAWAGQGSDVWFRTSISEPIMNVALLMSNYKLHIRSPEVMEYTFDWPPHTFIPPEKPV